MRILRVAQNVYPEQKGGASYHVHAMSRDQTEMGHEVTVLTGHDDPGQPSVEEREGYTIVRVSPGVTVLGNEISPAVARYLWTESREFDVIHAHSHLYFSTNLAALQRRLGGVPLAITNHGLYSQSAPEWVFDLYLKTLGRWTFNREDVKLYVVGDGPMRSELEREAGDAVEFLGQVPYEEMPAVYRAGDVLVLPSRAEGVPRTVLEAFASGVPVVSSDLKQVAPLVEESGVTVPVGDVDGFATGIEAVLAGEYGDPREVIEGSFDWAETVERTTSILEEL